MLIILEKKKKLAMKRSYPDSNTSILAEYTEKNAFYMSPAPLFK